MILQILKKKNVFMQSFYSSERSSHNQEASNTITYIFSLQQQEFSFQIFFPKLSSICRWRYCLNSARSFILKDKERGNMTFNLTKASLTSDFEISSLRTIKSLGLELSSLSILGLKYVSSIINGRRKFQAYFGICSLQ